MLIKTQTKAHPLRQLAVWQTKQLGSRELVVLGHLHLVDLINITSTTVSKIPAQR